MSLSPIDIRQDGNVTDDLEADLDPGSELSAKSDASDNHDEDAFPSRERPDPDIYARCARPKFLTWHNGGEEPRADHFPNPCRFAYSQEYKRLERPNPPYLSMQTPFWKIHLSRYEELRACCDKYSIDERTKDLAPYLYMCTVKTTVPRPEKSLEDWAMEIINVSLGVACELHEVPITSDIVDAEFDNFPDIPLYRRVYSTIGGDMIAFLHKFQAWRDLDGPRTRLMWKMAEKGESSEFYRQLDRPDNRPKLLYSIQRGYVTTSHGHSLL